MNESILQTIKQMIGLDTDDNSFNTDLIIHINSVFFILYQLGVGPDPPFSIVTGTETWTDFLGEDESKFEAVKTYVYMKTRIVFDPPTNATIMESLKSAISEYEFRLNVECSKYLEE